MAIELCNGLKECTDLFNNLAVSVGILLAVFSYSKNQFIANYENLNDRFLDFMQLQVEHPGLGTDTYDREPVALTDPTEIARRKAIFEFLCSLLERAFLYLNYGYDKILPWKKNEWDAWKKWILVYTRNQNFTEFWKAISDESCYSEEFVSYMNKEILPGSGPIRKRPGRQRD